MYTGVSGKLDARTILRCLARTILVGAAFNTRGMQNVGLIYAMEPGLRAIYPDASERRKARKLYMRHYNTHPFWTPLLVGVFLALEERISKGVFPRQMLANLKNTTAYTLSAIGDSVFGGTVLVFWSLSTACLLVSGHNVLGFLWAFAWLVGLQVFKVATFVYGFKEGLGVLQRLKRWDLINWGNRLKLVNAVFLALLLYLVWPGSFSAPHWVAGVSLLTALSLVVSRLHLSREVVLAILVALLAALPWLMRMLGGLVEQG